MSLPKVTLVGRLTADAEVKTVIEENTVTEFSVACDERKKTGDEWKDHPHFFNVFQWNRPKMARHLKKGVPVTVTGEIVQERWEKDGEKRNAVRIKAFEVVPHQWQEKDNSDESPVANEPPVDDMPF